MDYVYCHNGVKVVECRWLQSTIALVQFRFPKSKKLRIKKKWRKQSKNFKKVERGGIIKADGVLYASSEIFSRIKTELYGNL